MNDKQVPGNPPLTSHGTLQPIQGGMSFDGADTSLSGTLPSTACLVDPDMCTTGFALGMKLRFDDLSLTSNKPQYVVDTGASINGKGVSVFLQLNSLYFKVATSRTVYQVSLHNGQYKDQLALWLVQRDLYESTEARMTSRYCATVN